MKKEAKRKIITVSLIFVLGIIIIFYSIFPLLDEIKINSEDLVGTRIAMNQLIAKTKVPKDDFAELEEFVEAMDDLFISKEKPIETAVFLRDLAKKYNLLHEIKLIQPSQSSDEYWPYLNINLLLSGGNNNFFKFLEEIENNKLLVKISEIEIKKNTEENKIEAMMSLKFFYKE